MTNRKNLRLLTLVALAFLLVVPAGSFAGQLLGSHSLSPRIPSGHAATTTNLGFDCAYGSQVQTVGAAFPTSVATSSPYSSPDFDGSLDSSCRATYLADADVALWGHPLVSDNPTGTLTAAGAGGGLTIDVVANLNSTTTISGFDIAVQYDPNVLNAVLVDQTGLIWGGTGLPTGGFVLTLAKTFDRVAGTVRLAQVLVGAPQQGGSSELFRIRFDVVGASLGSPISFFNDVLANPSTVNHNDLNLNGPGVDTSSIYNFLNNPATPPTLNIAVGWSFSPNPEVPLSAITFTATTVSCPGCTAPFTYSWDFSSSDAPTYATKASATGNPTTQTGPPPPVINRVILTISDSALHTFGITRLLPLALKESPSFTTIANGVASGAWSAQWLGGVTTATAGYTGSWTFCPGNARLLTVCSNPAPLISQVGAAITQISTQPAITYHFGGLYNASVKVADVPENQIGTIPTGNVQQINFLNNVTGTPAAYVVNMSANMTTITAGKGINFTAFTSYNSLYPAGFASVGFKYVWDFGDGTTATSISNAPVGNGNQTSVVHTYLTPGTFLVKVTATETANAAVTHIAEVGRLPNILVNPAGGTFSATVSGPATGAVNQVLTYNAVTTGGTAPFTYAWAVTGGSPATGTASSFPTSFAVKGTYNVTLTVTDNTAKTAKAFELVTVTPLALIIAVGGPTTGTVNAAVSFTSTVSGGTAPYTYSWAVTGGSPASGTASTFSTTFAVKGTYNVTLTVTDRNSLSKIAFILVTISPSPLTASISGPTTGAVNVLQSFTSTVSGGTSPYTFAWAVTGGSPASGTASTFSTTFAVKGTYNVTLTVTDRNAATKTTFQLITISSTPLSVTIGGPTSGVVNALQSFTSTVTGGTSPYTFAWAVTGGSPASGTASTFSTTFAVKGTYNVTLTVTDRNGATKTAFQLVTIAPLTLTASIGGPTTGTVNAAVAFTSTVAGGTSPYTYAWAVTGGSPASGTASTFSSTFAVKGTYNLTLTVTDRNAKTASTFHLVTISPLTLTASIGGPTTGTVNTLLSFTSTVAGGTSPYTFAWAVTGGSPASGTASTFSSTFAVKGTYNLTLTVTDRNAKTASTFQLVTVSPLALTASIGGPTTGAVNVLQSFTSTVTGGTTPYTFAWAVTGGSPASGTASTFSSTFAVKGTYNVTLTVTDRNAKTASTFHLITISSTPLAVTVGGPTTGTVNALLSFTSTVSGGTSPYTFAWAVTGGSPASGTASTFSTTFAAKGTYNVTLTVTDRNGATKTAFQLVTVSPLALTVSISGPTTGTVNVAVSFTSTVTGGTSPYTFAWAVTGGSPASGTASTFSSTFAVKGTYNVTLTVTDRNAATKTTFQLVTISPLALAASIGGPTTGTVNTSLSFSSTVSGGTSPYTFAWAVTGGSPASGTASTFSTTFAVKGTYNVTLTVTDRNAKTAGAFRLVTISPLALTASISGPTSGAVNVLQSFTSTVTGGTTPYTFAWAVTGGSPASGTASTFSSTFAVKGTYNVTLTVTDRNAATKTTFQLITISSTPLAASISGPTTGTVNALQSFTSTVTGGTSPYTFAWAVTGGSPASGTASTFSTTFAVKGTYNVTLTVTDRNGATKTTFQLITISPLALTVSISGPTTGTVNVLQSFTSTVTGGTSPYTFAWAVTGGSPASGTASTFSTTFAVKGTYNVTLTVADRNAATKTAFQLVTIAPLTLTASISGPTTGTVNIAVSYTSTVTGGTSPYTFAWAVTGGSPASGTASTFSTTFAVKGTYNVTLTVTDRNAKTIVAFQLVTISPLALTASIGGPTSGAVNVLQSFTSTVAGGTTPYTYAWAVTGGSPASGTAATFSSTFAVKGTYNVTLTVTDRNARTASAFHLITISSTPLAASISGPTTGTVNALQSFTSTVSGGTSPYTFAWAVTGGSPASGTASTFSTTFAVKGTYNVTLTVTDRNGATKTAFQLVTISPLPLTASISGPTTGTVNTSLSFSSTVTGGTSPYTFAWAVTGGSPASGTASTFSTTFAVKGTYNVTLTVTDRNAKTVVAFQLVTISPLALTASIAGPTTGTVNALQSFTSTVTGGTSPYTFAWAVTGGSPASGTASTFSTTFAVKGTYNVTLTVADRNAATKTAFQLVTIAPLTLTASISGPTTGTVNIAVSYTSTVTGGTSPYTFAWAVTGGSPASGTASTFSTTFAVKGTYNVTLTVTDRNAKTAGAFRLVTISPLALTASISGPTSGTINALQSFTSTVTGGTSPYTFAWAVTGGSPASGTASTFSSTFAVKGTYNVTLTVTDRNAATKTTFQLIAISSTPLAASISGPATGTVNALQSFTSTVSGGTSPYTFAWAVTGGSPASGTASTFSTTFAVKGTYNVTLTVTDRNAATKTTFQLITISPLALTVSVSGPTTGTVNIAVSFTSTVSGGTSPYTYAWAVTGGSPASGTASTFSTTFAVKGTYNVTLTVTDRNAATKTAFQLVTISPLALTASIAGPTTGTVNALQSFTSTVTGGTSPYTYAWAVTGGSPASGTASSFSTTFAVKGTYNVTLTVTDRNARTASTFRLVTISPLTLTASISGPTTGIPGATLSFMSAVNGGTSPYTYAWAVTGGNPSSGTASTFSTSFATSGTFNITLTVTDRNARTATTFQLVTISGGCTASISGPTTGTVNQLLTFNAITSACGTPTFNWAVTGGSPASGTASTFSTTFAVKGTYNVTLTVTPTTGSAAHAFQLVTVSPLVLTDTIGGPTSGSVNTLLSFTSTVSGGTSPYTYAWAVTGGSPASGTSSTFSTTFAVKGTYNVTLAVTDRNGRTAFTFQLVNIISTPLAVSVTGPTTGTVNQLLSFTSTVSGGTSPYTYAWAVTGGSPASGTSASFSTSFAVKGTYNVTLTVTDRNGATKTAFQLVTISPLALTVSISGSGSGTVNQMLTFNAVVSGGTSPYTYSWAVTGGSPASGTSASFTTSFAVKGTYNVTLTVTDRNARTATTFVLVAVTPLALTASITGPTSGTINTLLSFSSTVSGGTSPYTYAWAVTGGSPASGTAATFSSSFAVKGTYNVTLTVTDRNAKTASAFRLVSISSTPLTVSIGGPTSGSVNTLLSFTSTVSGGTSPYTYAWAVTGGSPAGGTASTFSTTFAVKGTYNVTLTVTDRNGATKTTFQLVTVSPLALAASISGPSTGTVNTAVGFTSTVSGGTTPYSYAWAVTGGSPAGGTASTFSTSFAVKGTYNVTLTVTDRNGASKTVFQLVTISPLQLTASISGPASGAVNQVLAFNAVVNGGTSPYTYSWVAIGGSPSSGTSASFSTSFAVKGTYTVNVTVTDHNGAVARAFQRVIISPLTLTASVSGPSIIAVGVQYTFNSAVSGGTAPYTYAWAASGGSPSSGTSSSFTTSFAVKGTYNVTLTVTDQNGKTASAFEITMAQGTPLTASINGPTSGGVNALLSYTSTVSGGTSPYTYSWTATGGSPASGTAASFSTSFAVKGTYTVSLVVTDHNGATATASQTVNVSPLTLTASINGPATGTVAATLSYTSTVTGGTTPYSYSWTATGGSPASGTLASFSTSFSTKGTYTVSLRVTDRNGAVATAFQMVNISPLALTISAITGPSTTTTGTSVTFTTTASGGTQPYTFAWNFGDGSTGTTGTHTYTMAGTFMVTVTVTDHNGATATSAAFTITVTTVTTQDSDGDGIFDNVDTQPTVFSNDFTDVPLGGTTFGTTLSRGDQCPTIPCQLTVQEATGGAGILITSGSAGGLTPASISVCGGAGILSVGADTQLTVKCGTVTITVITGSVGETLVGSGTFAGVTGTTTITAGNSLTFDPTTFTLTAPATNNATILVTINGQTVPVAPGQTTSSPFAIFSVSPNSAVQSGQVLSATLLLKFDGRASFSTVAKDPIVTYTWNFGDGTPTQSGSLTQTTHTYAVAGTYVATLTVTDRLGTQGTSSQTLTILPAPIMGTVTFSHNLFVSGNRLTQNFTVQVTNPNSYPILVNVNVSGNCDTICPFTAQSGPVLVGAGQTIYISVFHTFSPLDQGKTFNFEVTLSFTTNTSNTDTSTYTLAATKSSSFQVK